MNQVVVGNIETVTVTLIRILGNIETVTVTLIRILGNIEANVRLTAAAKGSSLKMFTPSFQHIIQ